VPDYAEKVSRAAIRHHPQPTSGSSTQATFSWHWFFNIQPYDLPERMMGADPDWFIEKKLAKTKQGLSFFDKDALAEFKRCFRNPETIPAICEDYRAEAGIDVEMYTRDFAAGRKIECPVLLLWGATGSVGRNSKPGPAEIWKAYASNIRDAKAVQSGHYLSDEAPAETTAALHGFHCEALDRRDAGMSRKPRTACQNRWRLIATATEMRGVWQDHQLLSPCGKLP
jgi:haloacetate dehalogenase